MGRQTPLWIAKSSKDDKMWVLPCFGVSGPQAGPFSHTLARFLPPNGQWEDFPRTRIQCLHGPAREPHRTLNRINNILTCFTSEWATSKLTKKSRIRASISQQLHINKF